MSRNIIYYDKIKDLGLSVGHSNWKDKTYLHISLNMYDPDSDQWYRVKGLSVTEDYLDYILEGLILVEKQLTQKNLPDVRQLTFSFMKGN